MTTLTADEHNTLRRALADALVPHQAALGDWIGALARLGLVDLADTPLPSPEADLHFARVHTAFRRVNVAGRELMRRADRLLDALRAAPRTGERGAVLPLPGDVVSGLAAPDCAEPGVTEEVATAPTGCKDFHFNLGNSARGPIGYCARVFARTEDEAVAVLRGALPEEIDIAPIARAGQVDYIAVYFNRNAFSAADIDEEEDAGDVEPRDRNIPRPADALPRLNGSQGALPSSDGP